jgi:hypothetical protein
LDGHGEIDADVGEIARRHACFHIHQKILTRFISNYCLSKQLFLNSNAFSILSTILLNKKSSRISRLSVVPFALNPLLSNLKWHTHTQYWILLVEPQIGGQFWPTLQALRPVEYLITRHAACLWRPLWRILLELATGGTIPVYPNEDEIRLQPIDLFASCCTISTFLKNQNATKSGEASGHVSRTIPGFPSAFRILRPVPPGAVRRKWHGWAFLDLWIVSCYIQIKPTEFK